MALTLILGAVVFSAFSGVPGLFLPRRSAAGQASFVVFMLAGSLLGLAGAWSVLTGGSGRTSGFFWPAVGNSLLGLDPLGAFFLVPVFLMAGLGAVYGLGYWPNRQYPRTGRKLRLFWGFLAAGMGLLLIGRHALAFLLGWEIMALAAFFLVSLEDDREESRRAGLIYLIATHVSTLTLFALFVLWRKVTGAYVFSPVSAAALDIGVLNGLFFLSLLGFGLKAGMMPLHFWLPGAHAAAPSHVSAMLSGVVLKMGIYGLLRMLSLLPEPPAAWGGLILVLGAVSGLLGVVFAIGQHDLKRLLAYHSVENIGIILMGLGLAMLGRSSHRPEWIVLGAAGCLLHVWNHGLFKALLFLCAGSVLHGAGTRKIDRLGGLAKAMPRTAALFFLGAAAISGLPPLNGFVSELLVYLGLFNSVNASSAAVLAAPVLAMIGALALACFVKVYGAVFLGIPRTEAAARSREAPLSMLGPAAVLAVLCVLLGFAPWTTIPILDRVIASWLPGTALRSLETEAPLVVVGLAAVLLTAGIVIAVLAFRLLGRGRRNVGTWDCGYAEPTARMQYTASSFAQTIVGIFDWVLHPHVRPPRIEGPFPAAAGMYSHVDDTVLDRLLVPAARGLERWFGWFRRFQKGLTQNYVLYILVALGLLLCTLVPVDELLAFMFAR